MKYFNTVKHRRLSMLVVMVMLLQVLMPAVGEVVWAEGDEDGPFKITIGDIVNGETTIEWEFELDPDKEIEIEPIELGLTLEEAVEEGDLVADDDVKTVIGTYSISEEGIMTVEIHKSLYNTEEAQGDDPIGEKSGDPDGQDDSIGSEGREQVTESENTEDTEGIGEKQEDTSTEIEEGEEIKDIEEPITYTFKGNFVVEGVVEEEFLVEALAEIEKNLVTSFEFQFNDSLGNWTTVEDGGELELDITELNSVKLKYGLTRPDGLIIKSGDTYTIDLPVIYGGKDVSNQPIKIGETQVATYDIEEGKLIITFNENVNKFDDVEMFVELTGAFDTQVFETEEEVVIEVPYSEEKSFTATIRAEQEKYEGEDKKTAGSPYIINEDGSKTYTDKNPTHIDWTVRANDNMKDYENATIVDDLGKGLKIVEGSFIVEKIIRNYENKELRREAIDVTSELLTITDKGFELKLGAIKDAYEITYTTMVERPDGGGKHTINNNAKIILDGVENKVSASFEGTWSGDLPVITKEGKVSNDDPHIIDWEVKYNYGKENLGTVTLTDELSKGEVIADTIKVYEVNPDIDGNVSEYGAPNSGSFPLTLDANGKAYYITFSSSIPVGLNETVINTISDDLTPPNSDSDSVDVNTIPTGGKVGEQHVDENGKPYVKWTITMNSEKINVGSITVRDVFNPAGSDGEYWDFNVSDTSLFDLYKDGDFKNPVNNFTINSYTHKDGRTGFELNITDAGPHTYNFVYRTYYTELGMQQPELANHAELVFKDGDGDGIGEPIKTPDATITGPKAGIEKTGKYVTNDDKTQQEIEWKITFNESKILLNANSTLTDEFTSKNYTYINDSLSLKDGDTPLTLSTDYELNLSKDEDGKEIGFGIKLLKDTKATLTITYRTKVDDTDNKDHTNKATLTWQGGEETADAKVDKRDPGSNKTGEVVINDDGSKTVNWTINFNTNKNIIHKFKLVDNYTPTTVTVSDIKITSGGTDVTEDFEIIEAKDGTFTVTKNKLDAKAYQLTYSTTLSAEEEKENITNTAEITYTGGSEKPTKTISSPSLGVSKQATKLNKEADKPIISWQINANTDNTNKYVNLVNPVLKDTIPGDQALIQDSIVVKRADGKDFTLAEDAITSDDNSFSIKLPNGPYQYIVTFDTEILEYPSFHETKLDRYTNSTTLSNDGYDNVLADAYQDYFDSGDAGLVGKSGAQNVDTENLDWTVTVNEEGLTIKNPEIKDELSDKHTYLQDTIKVMDKDKNELAKDSYTLVFAKDNRSFTLRFTDNVITGPITLSYSTRLNPELIGKYNVSNKIMLSGGQEQREIYTKVETTTSQQWSYGGGGSGRTLEFELNKVKMNGLPLEGVEFSLERLDFNGELIETKYMTTDANGVSKSERIRAGRYILKEIEPPTGYQSINPIYFTIGYSAPGSEHEYTITFMDAQWEQEAIHPNATAEGNLLTVVNQYDNPSKVEIVASKILEGQRLVDGQFEFKLLDSEGKVIETVTNNAQGQIIFSEITYDKSGKYEYTIVEVKGSQGGITYDDIEYKVTVTIDDTKNARVVYENNEAAVFKNTYTPDPDSIVLEAKKILRGQILKDDQFEFELLDSEGKVIETVTNNAQGQIIFSEISYDEVGEYRYTIREVKGTQQRMTYDDTEYNVLVTVRDDGEGNLIAGVSNIDMGDVVFNNRYTPPTDPDRPDPYDPYEPTKPTDPTDPEKPTEPTKPVDPEKPTDPTDPEDPTVGIDDNTPEGDTNVDKEDKDKDTPNIDLNNNTPKGGKDVDKPTLPKTGENNNIFFYFIGLILITLGFALRRKTA